ncbi:MAG: serine--tRNA ligase [Cyclobacteriaceae bacterium]|nr:serine--tRNA ligase [Cyclobacteriaceae bacterium]MCK5279806.1 serine--tRNA ligase [Cyclobacteriaceae bacterium]MCK5372476.1 serine--tRNA ligase [Cyclobacteriaceae bacterium]
MLRIADIKEDLEKVVKGLEKKRVENASQQIDHLLKLDENRRNTQAELDAILNELKNISKQIGALMQTGDREGAEKAKVQTGEMKSKSKLLQEQLKSSEEQLMQALYNLPNRAHERVPVGNSAEDNEVILEKGEIPILSNDAQPHWELIEKYDIIDFSLGNKISGAGFPVYKGKGAKLQRALISFFLDEAAKEGFEEIQPPVVINSDSGYGTGQLPDKEGQMYGIVDSDLFLIPTGEVPITNIYRDVILKEVDLPIRNVGYSLCFRKEAGSWGAHVRGLNRLHQFDKVEIVQITKPEDSYKALDNMCTYIEGLLEKLELPFRKLLLCGGDLGFTSAMTYDMEVYSAAQKKWLEVSSVSNFEAYQANRLKLRYKKDGKKTTLLHTLNGSALALPRIVAALLENNQNEKGIAIPKILRSYTGFDRIS